jgi:predicted acetylornithine/succinylornithine family transaminase
MSYLLPVYRKLNIDVGRAQGKHIWDRDRKKYTDFLSGISVTNLGHRPEKVIEAINKEVSKYLHISNLYAEKFQEDLARELAGRTIRGKVFFSNSGAEANECAIKTARKYFNGEKYEIISFVNSFHGRTLATLAATGQKKFRDGFGPMPEGFVHAEYNFLASVEDRINHKTCAIMVESIQGEGGVIIAENDFMKGLRKICDDNNLLLIADEIQTGIGRTGKFLGMDYYGIKPDIITLGKALGGGLPLGATVISEKAAQHMDAGTHGSTFGGNPLACAASLATIKAVDEKMLASVTEKGAYFMKELDNLRREFETVVEVSGKGLMIGMELEFKGEELVEYLLDKGYIVNCTQDRVIRFLPPFIIETKDIDGLVREIRKYLRMKIK